MAAMSRMESRGVSRCDSMRSHGGCHAWSHGGCHAVRPLYPESALPDPTRPDPYRATRRRRLWLSRACASHPTHSWWSLVASAERKHLIAACVAAVDLRENVAPNARLWLARASLKCDEKGRTKYSAERYADDTNDSIDSGERAIELLQKLGLVVNDVDEDGDDCLRLIHHQWDREDVITGYGRDAGQKRDGLPS